MLCRGDFYYADLSPVVGCEQGGVRPVLIVQNNVGNRYSPTVIVAAVTSRMEKHPLPTHVFINRNSCKFSCRMQSRPTSTPYRPLKLLTWSESS